MNPPNDDMERRLRAALDAQARNAPPGAPLAERILIEVDAPVLRPRHGWRTWASPLIAAAAIVAAALAVVGVNNAHFGAEPAAPPTHGTSTPPVQQPTTARPTPSHSTTTPPTAVVPGPFRTADTGGVHGFRAVDITFDSQTEGWALGSARCVTGPGRCTEILHTTDGTHWLAAPKGENFNVLGLGNCDDPCVWHLRFASSTTGYAYGPSALFMTTDGGAHWARQKGLGADVLETVDNNVILVEAVNTPKELFKRAPIGSDQWSSFANPGLPNIPIGGRLQLARTPGVSLLAVTDYDPAKGGPLSSGALFRSTDGGATWKQLERPCGIVPAGSHGTIAAATVAAGDGSMAIDCSVQTAQSLTGFGNTVSAPPGSTAFTRPVHGGKLTPAAVIASPSDSVQFVVEQSTGTTYRSDDTGDSWTPVPQLKGVTFIGFESATVGRALGNDGRSIWTTHDAGTTWSEVRFPA